MDFIRDIPASIYTTSAFIVGLLLSDDLNPAEQNSLGSWFMLVGQTLCTNSSQQQLLNNRNNQNNASNFSSKIVNDDNLRESASNIKNEINNIFNNYNKKSS